jgi:hypothetical protein
MSARFTWAVPPAILFALCLLYRATALPPPVAPSVLLKRDTPAVIAPRYNDPRVATDEQLARALDRLKPPAGAPNTNHMIHALRLWGPHADFGDARFLSGPAMLAYLTDDRTFQRLAGEAAAPLLVMEKSGRIGVRAWTADHPAAATASVHADDLLATLGECGLPLTAPIVTRTGVGTVRDLLLGALGRYHLNQLEFEWTAISFARYACPARWWINDYGQRIDIDNLLRLLIDLPLRDGVCAGTHRLEALVVLLAADERARALSDRQRRRIVAHLSEVSGLLMSTQSPAGYWRREWQRPATANATTPLADRILATGHHLEWLALAPEAAQPSRECIVRAAQWLARAMIEVDQATLAAEYGPFSHAARALCLWRSQEPFQAWRAAQTQLARRQTPPQHADE